MKLHLLSLFFFLVMNATFAQTTQLPIEWQKIYGGTNNDYARKIIPTDDGGYIIAGVTVSTNGNVATHTGRPRIWLLKVSGTGEILWQKFYGPERNFSMEIYIDIAKSPDGGYIMCGSVSAKDPSYTNYHGSIDALLIKVTDDGTPVWQKCFGGSGADYGISVIASGNGYVFTGWTNSKDGDLSKNYGGLDVWVTRLNLNGEIEWLNTFGGSQDDKASHIISTQDGGLILTANVGSNDHDVTGYHTGEIPGVSDLWVLKLNSQGQKEWQKCLGGSRQDYGADIFQKNDGNYIVAGSTNSMDGDISGVHMQNNSTFPSQDAWVLELSASGNLVWQKCYGGSSEESASGIYKHPDGNFVITGSVSSITGDMQDVHPVSGSGIGDLYLLKINGRGDILSSHSFGGTRPDLIADLLLQENNGLLILANTQSWDGDVVGSYTRSPNHNSYSDIWLFKTTNTNLISGQAFIDYNSNGIKDADDAWVEQALVKSQKNNYQWQTNLIEGRFENNVDTGNYTSSLNLPNAYYSVSPTSVQSTFGTYGITDSVKFILTPTPGIEDFYIDLVPLSATRAGMLSHYLLFTGNYAGAAASTREVRFIKDPQTVFDSYSPVPAKISGDTLFWSINILPGGRTDTLSVSLLNNEDLEIDDTLYFSAYIDSSDDVKSDDNFATATQLVTGSFDPNDKTENSGGSILQKDIADGKNLLYTIRFQNTGNDTAFNIVVKDTLENTLDWNSFQMVASSHKYKLRIDDQNKVSWTFKNILLVDSSRNEPLSHGFIAFKIKPNSTLSMGDSISNKASIYFDFNPPINTNIAKTFVKRVIPVPAPIFEALATNYCEVDAPKKIKLTNFPEDGITVAIKLNQRSLTVGADSTIVIEPAELGAGEYNLSVSYSNSSETKTTSQAFSITAAVAPKVKLASNQSQVSLPEDRVIITATAQEGGGTNPQYEFSRDRNFANNIIQPLSAGNQISLTSLQLIPGENWIYVRLKTSAACYKTQTSTDSIRIERKVNSNGSGITDPDNPGQVIQVYPNPFADVIDLHGLSASKTYSVQLFDQTGRKIFQHNISNVSSAELHKPGLPVGKYTLHLIDQKKSKKIGTISLLKR